MQKELSILIPSNREMFLARTVQDLLEHIEADTEILVGLDGAWADPVIPDHPRVKIFHSTEVLGQRAMTNQLARLSKARYLIKVDAHASFDQGFDRKMLEFFKEVGDDVVAVPVMRNLHAFNWVCPDGHIRYQSPSGVCITCGKPTERDVVWIAKLKPESTSYCFDSEPHFNYFREYTRTEKYKKDLAEKGYTESMSLQGSFFMSTRHNYWKYQLCDERAGSWGNQGIELACAAWLSGLRVLVNHKTWYAHMFRTQGPGFGFPYENPGSAVDRTKRYIKDKIWNGKMPQQKLPVSWLIKRFYPIKGWSQNDLDKLLEFEASVSNFSTEKFGVLGVVPIVPSTMTNHTTPVSLNGDRQEMPIPAMSLSSLSGSSSITEQDVFPIGDKTEMGGITTSTIDTNMVKDGNITPLSNGQITNEPHIHKTVGTI